MSRTIKRKNILSRLYYCTDKQYRKIVESRAMYWAYRSCAYEGSLENLEKFYFENFKDMYNPRQIYRYHSSPKYGRGLNKFLKKYATDRRDRVSIRNDLSNVYKNWNHEVISHNRKKKAGYWT